MEVLPEGFNFVNPISSIHSISGRVLKAELKGANASTDDLQKIHTDLVVNYRIDQVKAPRIFKEFGFNFEEVVLLPMINESLKAVTARYSSTELITKRDEVSLKIKEELQSKATPYNLTIAGISLVNFGFSPDFEKAIESKVIAIQLKQKADQDLERIKVEASQAIAKAEGDAKAIQIETAAINSAGGANYVQLKAIQRWDGKLPQVSGGNTPFINLNGIGKTQ